MAAANSKQAARAVAIKAAAEQLRDGLAALQAIGYQAGLDGVTLTGVDLSAVMAPPGRGPAAAITNAPATLSYLTGAQLDAVVAAAAQIGQFVQQTTLTGSPVSIGAAIAAVCGS